MPGFIMRYNWTNKYLTKYSTNPAKKKPTKKKPSSEYFPSEKSNLQPGYSFRKLILTYWMDIAQMCFNDPNVKIASITYYHGSYIRITPEDRDTYRYAEILLLPRKLFSIGKFIGLGDLPNNLRNAVLRWKTVNAHLLKDIETIVVDKVTYHEQVEFFINGKNPIQ